jgi:hypothetical protein
MQRYTRIVTILTGLMLMALAAARPVVAQLPHKDYLSDEEADKIRDADTPSLRIKLYLTFAEDRLQKFEYEIHRKVPERHRSDILNGLLNGYVGCVDDAADQIGVARDKQIGIRDALKLMQAKGKEFLALLEKYDKNGPELDNYRDTLEDAIQGTKDALSDASEAEKEMLPPPVRRKP